MIFFVGYLVTCIVALFVVVIFMDDAVYYFNGKGYIDPIVYFYSVFWPVTVLIVLIGGILYYTQHYIFDKIQFNRILIRLNRKHRRLYNLDTKGDTK